MCRFILSLAIVILTQASAHAAGFGLQAPNLNQIASQALTQDQARLNSPALIEMMRLVTGRPEATCQVEPGSHPNEFFLTGPRMPTIIDHTSENYAPHRIRLRLNPDQMKIEMLSGTIANPPPQLQKAVLEIRAEIRGHSAARVYLNYDTGHFLNGVFEGIEANGSPESLQILCIGPNSD